METDRKCKMFRAIADRFFEEGNSLLERAASLREFETEGIRRNLPLGTDWHDFLMDEINLLSARLQRDFAQASTYYKAATNLRVLARSKPF